MAQPSPEDFFKSSDPHTILECAKFYAYELGWVLQPIHKAMGFASDGRLICSCELTGQKWKNCNPEKPGKHPWAGWKQKPMETPEQGFSTFYEVWQQYPHGVNIGIRTGQVSGMWAVDMDVGRMKNGLGDFEAWLSKNGLGWSDVDTLRATTGGGGVHLIFSYPPNVDKITTVAPHPDLGPAVDVKGDGGYILVAPSVHASGKQYRWDAQLSKASVRAAPEKLMRTVQGKSKRDPGIIDSGYTPSLPELKNYADELSRKRTPRAKEIGSNMLFALSGSAIAEDGGAHDAYRDIMYVIAKKWDRCDPKEIVAHFEDSVHARFEGKPDASTGMSNLLDAMCSALEKTVEESKSWSGQLKINEKGEPLDTHSNLYSYFMHHEAWKGVLAFNMRTRKPVFLKAPPTEHPPLSNEIDLIQDGAMIAHWFATRVKMAGQISKNNLQSAMTSVAVRNAFDPLQQAFNALAGLWDGVPRIDTALQRVAGVPDDAWARLVGPLWFKSLAARVLWPGCKVDTMLILEGHQGFLKSTFFKALLPDGYFSDSLFRINHNMESIRQIHSGPAIFELGELTGLRKQEVDEIKAFLSAQSDDLRALYENYKQAPRRCIFVGSTNLNEYLRDETGGRRFWPLRVTRRIDIATVHAERDQWLAEAVHRVTMMGEIWWLPDAQAEALAAAEQSSRYEADIWLQPIAEWLARQPVALAHPSTATEQMQQQMNKECAGEYVTTLQVALYALKLEVKNARSAEGMRINKILRRLGWIPSHTTINGINMRVWKRPRGGMQPD